MPVIPEARRYTVADLEQFPDDGNRYEIVHGELLVTPAPRVSHQAVVSRLVYRLVGYLDPLGRGGTVFAGPADIIWDEETWVQPDVLVMPPEEVSPSWRTCQTLLLAVEVLSPSSARGDRVVKRRLYQDRKVGSYWIVDAERRVVEVWHPEDEVAELATDLLRWRVTSDAPELEISLPEVWAAVPR